MIAVRLYFVVGLRLLTIRFIANQSTQARVVYWGFIEAGVVIVVAVFQIWWLRRFFEVKRNV
jgi:multisubunit Na+/H+ antiporter MnhF subunit